MKAHELLPLGGLCGLLLVTAGTSLGQTRLYSRPGRTPGAQFGVDVAWLADLDGDGRSEWMAGRGGGPAELRVHSGADGALLYVLEGSGPVSTLGPESLADLGDVDLDGVHDFAFGNALAKVNGLGTAGRVVVYSGADGKKLWKANGPFAGSAFGASLAALGDLNGDGVTELVVGQFGSLDENAWVLDGATGAALVRAPGPRGGDWEFGYACAAAGDLDGDGLGDFAVGTYWADRVFYYASRDGALLFVASGAPGFGRHLADVGDVDGDGLRDLCASETSLHAVRLLSGAGGATLARFVAPGGVDFGRSLASAGDVDGDGAQDVLVGDPQADGGRGAVWVWSTRTARVLHVLRGEEGLDAFGSSVAGGGDVDGDGRTDWLIGAVGVDGLYLNAGEVSVWSGR